MIKTNYYLAEPQKSESRVFMTVKLRHWDKFIKVYPSIKVKPKDFDKKTQRLKPQCADYWLVKEKFDTFQQAIENEYKKNIGIPEKLTKQYFEQFIDTLLSPVPDNFDKRLYEYLDEYLNDHKDKYEYTTRQKYITVFNHIKDFEKATEYPVTFYNINNQFFENLKEYYFYTIDLQNSSAGRYIRAFNAFMTWANEKGITDNKEHLKFKFNYNEETTTIALTAKERQHIFDMNLSNNKRLEAVRDVFCLGMYTGLRFSDLERLTKANIQNNALHFVAYKTVKPQVIPLITQSKYIIDKYWNEPNFLPVISNQKTNEYLKELGKLAGIDYDVQKVHFQGKKRIEEIKPKYQYIGTHTARRTFGTNYLLDGGNIEILQRIFGHSTIDTTMKYLGITAIDIRNDMEKVFGKIER